MTYDCRSYMIKVLVRGGGGGERGRGGGEGRGEGGGGKSVAMTRTDKYRSIRLQDYLMYPRVL